MRKMQWQIQPLEKKKENVTYQHRYGVYAVIPDAEGKQIVLVQAPMVLGSYQVVKLKQVKIIKKH